MLKSNTAPFKTIKIKTTKTIYRQDVISIVAVSFLINDI